MFILKIVVVVIGLFSFYKLVDKKFLKKEKFDATILNKNLEKDVVMGFSQTTGIPFEYEVQRHFITVSLKEKEYLEEVTPELYQQKIIGEQVIFIKLYTRFSNKHIRNQIIE